MLARSFFLSLCVIFFSLLIFLCSKQNWLKTMLFKLSLDNESQYEIETSIPFIIIKLLTSKYFHWNSIFAFTIIEYFINSKPRTLFLSTLLFDEMLMFFSNVHYAAICFCFQIFCFFFVFMRPIAFVGFFLLDLFNDYGILFAVLNAMFVLFLLLFLFLSNSCSFSLCLYFRSIRLFLVSSVFRFDCVRDWNCIRFFFISFSFFSALSLLQYLFFSFI